MDRKVPDCRMEVPLSASAKGISKNTLLIEEMQKILDRQKFSAEQTEAFERFVARMKGDTSPNRPKKATTRVKA